MAKKISVFDFAEVLGLPKRHLYSCEQTAELLGVSRATVRRLERAKRLRSVNITNKSKPILAESIQEVIDAGLSPA